MRDRTGNRGLLGLFGSRALLIKLAGDLRASYWFLPAVFVLLAAVLAGTTLWLDHQPEVVSLLPDTLRAAHSEGARALLASISGAIIGVAGVMFSLTMVAVSFASGQFGPRLIGNFMRDRGTQVSLGILISTFVYSVLVLGAVQDPDDGGLGAFVPHIAVLTAMTLTLVSVFTMIYFIHHVPETINVSRIAANLGRKLADAVRADIADPPDGHDGGEDDEALRPATRLRLVQSGYVQSVDLARLKEIADLRAVEVHISANPGDYVTPLDDVVEVRGAAALDDDDAAALRACFAVGDRATELQNPAFLVDLLVEMIARALSSGINDPQTAIDCINRLQTAHELALGHEGGLSRVAFDRVGRGRLTFLKLLERSYGAAMPYVRHDPLASRHLRRCLERLDTLARDDEERQAIAALLESVDP